MTITASHKALISPLVHEPVFRPSILPFEGVPAGRPLLRGEEEGVFGLGVGWEEVLFFGEDFDLLGEGNREGE